MKRTTLLLSLWISLSLSTLGWAQCKAVVTGPKESLSGDLVILDASQSQAQKYLWKLLESDKSFLSTDGGLKCIFAAGVDEPRTFHFILVVAGTNANGGPEVDIATHDLLVKPRNYTPPVVKPETPVNPQTPAPTNPSRPTRVTYLFEKDSNPVPSAVLKGLISLNGTDANAASSVYASYFEIDGTAGDGDVPKQYEIAVKAGKDSIPCLVVENKDGTTKVIKNPKTTDDVLNAVKETK